MHPPRIPLTLGGPKENLEEGSLHYYRRVFVGSIGSDCNPIRTVIFSCLTKTDIAIRLAMFCKQRSFGTPRTVHHTKSCLKLSFYRSVRIYRVDFEKI